ncbi:MAG: MFS transporter [Gammaproteobacteria bacterium]|nr:MFS transporter [Gammaproteobacteria bacterium]
MNRTEKYKILFSCLSGSVLEWFDFAVYGYLTSIIASQFFPSTNKLASILLTYAVFATGFLFRPLGAILFGYIGDRLGRKAALVTSSLLMAVPTFIIGTLPNYASIGMFAPLLLIFCRILQGISVGGEFTGSFIYLIENATPGKKGFFSCFADIGCCLGMILGSLCVALLNSYLTPEQLESFGWRLPFLGGIVLSMIALYIRTCLPESSEFQKAKPVKKMPLQEIFTQFPKTFIYSTLLMAINAIGFYLLVVFIPNQAVLMGKIPAASGYLVNTIILSVLMVALFVAACACDYFDKTKIYFAGILGCMLLAYPVFYAVTHFDLFAQVVMNCLLAVAVGFCFGPRPLLLVSVYSATVRYTAIALALNIANAVLGGTAPLMATYLLSKTGSIQSIAILIFLGSAVSLYALLNLVKLGSLVKFSKSYQLIGERG